MGRNRLATPLSIIERIGRKSDKRSLIIEFWSHMRTLPYSVPATTTSRGFSLPHVTRISATAPFPRTTALSTTIPSAAVCEPTKNRKKTPGNAATQNGQTIKEGGNAARQRHGAINQSPRTQTSRWRTTRSVTITCSANCGQRNGTHRS